MFGDAPGAQPFWFQFPTPFAYPLRVSVPLPSPLLQGFFAVWSFFPCCGMNMIPLDLLAPYSHPLVLWRFGVDLLAAFL